MNITPEQLQKVLNGDYSFSQLGFSMLITRLKTVYKDDPTPSTLQSCAREVNTFIGKYGGIMRKDCSILANL